MNIKIKIERNQFIISTEKQVKTFSSSRTFSSARLLVSDFEVAKNCLTRGAKEMGLVGFFKGKHDIRIEVGDYFSDGITPVERQIYRGLVKDLRIKSFELELIKNA